MQVMLPSDFQDDFPVYGAYGFVIEVAGYRVRVVYRHEPFVDFAHHVPNEKGYVTVQFEFYGRACSPTGYRSEFHHALLEDVRREAFEIASDLYEQQKKSIQREQQLSMF